jgi:hypothetical protein
VDSVGSANEALAFSLVVKTGPTENPIYQAFMNFGKHIGAISLSALQTATGIRLEATD